MTDQTIWVYGSIGEDVEAGPIARTLADDPAAEVTVRINSPGGMVAEGQAIYNALRRHPGRVRVEIDGLAASIASLIAMAGDHVVAAENSIIMIHSPWAATSGNAEDLRQNADALDKVARTMVIAYRNKSHQSEDYIRKTMTDETWLVPEEALQAGFIDEISQPLAIAASINLNQFNNVPKHIMEHHAMAKQTDKAGSTANAAATDQAAQAAVLDFQAREHKRRVDIRAKFKPFASREGIGDVLDGCLDDPGVSVQAAQSRLLTALGAGSEPLGGYMHQLPGGDIRTDGAFPGHGPYSPGSRVSVGNDGGAFMAAATDGLLQRAGIRTDEPHPAARDFEHTSLAGMAEICLSRAGKRMDFGGSDADKIKAASQSTSDFPAILENTANKSLLVGLDAEGIATHRGTWTTAGNLADFKEAKRIAMSEAPNLRKLHEGAEIQHGNILDAGAESISLDTYAGIISISRQAMINDDLDAFTKVPMLQGQSASRAETDLVYSVLGDNPQMRDGKALFHADHGNLATTGADITVEALGHARAAMRKQRGAQSESFLNVTPRFMIVGADRETEALKVLAQTTPAKTNDAVPAWMRELVLIVDPRVDDIDSGAWFLAADASIHSTVEVGYLDGRRVPQLEREESFNTLDFSWRAVFDFGVAALDWRGLYKNPGPA